MWNLFKKQPKKHTHKFEVQWYKKTRKLVQLIYCKTCNKYYWGYDGELYKPKYLHEVKDISLFSNVLEHENVIEKVGTIGGEKKNVKSR